MDYINFYLSPIPIWCIPLPKEHPGFVVHRIIFRIWFFQGYWMGVVRLHPHDTSLVLLMVSLMAFTVYFIPGSDLGKSTKSSSLRFTIRSTASHSPWRNHVCTTETFWSSSLQVLPDDLCAHRPFHRLLRQHALQPATSWGLKEPAFDMSSLSTFVSPNMLALWKPVNVKVEQIISPPKGP